MNVLSLFDGISCGRVALERANITITKYYASEIDRYATQISSKNYPDIERLGDVSNWKNWNINWQAIDLIIGGSPCQGFSFAGKQLKFKDHRSQLVFTFIDIVRHCQALNPHVKFLLENVRMESACEKHISRLLEVDPLLIDSALVSAQSRKRLYWCNWHVQSIPQNKGIYLIDILEDGFTDRDKSLCLTATYSKGTTLEHYKNKHNRQIVFIKQRARGFNKGGDFYQKAPTLTSSRWEQNNILHLKPIQVGMLTGKGHDIDKRIYSPFGKCPTLTTQSGGNRERKIVITNVNPSGIGINGSIPSIYAKSPIITTNKGEGSKIGKADNETIIWRKLTPIECERLQTLPDNYTDCVTKTQRYKAIGNGWTVDVISHLLQYKNNPPQLSRQVELF